MEFESPDVMKDFPGLFVSEGSKKGSNDSDYSDETDKLAKKDLLKRKEKKDKKDKERGYAALEGESSADENDSSPSKIKKSKTFKFTTSKSKEKREKSREKELIDKKSKEKEKKSEKKVEKDKKAEKKERKCKSADEHTDIADGMPIFGVPLDIAVERSRCHDGIDIPLPVRACIDYIQSVGLTLEGVYKMSGTKAKVLQLRKLYNQREHVDLTEYEIPIATSLLKLFLRDLPEPIFTSDMLVRFEEAGAILNVGTREKHLKILVENLPPNNRLLLSWILIHLDDVVLNERLNKMNISTMVGALGPTLHTSSRLLTALLHHCRALFPTVILEAYIPPLSSTEQLPVELDQLEVELLKQESLLSQIHAEMNAGYIIKTREELLWEVQRIITQLKRKIKNLQKEEKPDKVKEVVASVPAVPINPTPSSSSTTSTSTIIKETVEIHTQNAQLPQPTQSQLQETQDEEEPIPLPLPTEDSPDSSPPSSDSCPPNNTVVDSPQTPTPVDAEPPPAPQNEQTDQNKLALERRQLLDNSLQPNTDESIALLQIKHTALCALRDKLTKTIQNERQEVLELKKQIVEDTVIPTYNNDQNMDEIMTLLQQENQILEIKKINLVRRIMEQEEMCIDLRSKLVLIQ
ncbi:ralA-binding protein 1 isoform X2 [Atheta coriaria]|uniref:ralA-binding protein 1 isoform X2 n=1 Tax=Dalotia coriaria TaxID=877792 RepID=UPI0031F39B08